MAERMDGTLFDLDGSTMASRVVEIIGGLGQIQSLQDAVEAAVAALDGDSIFHHSKDVWITHCVSEEDSDAPEPFWVPGGASSEPQAEDVGLTEAATLATMENNPVQLETDSNNDRGDVDVTTLEDENETVLSEDVNTPLCERLSKPQPNPLTEERETSAQDQTSGESLTAFEDESPAEPQTELQPEVHSEEGSVQEETMTSPEGEMASVLVQGMAKSEPVLEQEMESDAKLRPVLEQEMESDAKSEPALEQQMESDTKSEPALEQQMESDTKSEPALEQQMESDAKSEPALEQEMESDTKSEPALEQQMESDAKSEPALEQQMESDTKSEPALEQEMESDTKSEPVQEQEMESEAKSEPVLEEEACQMNEAGNPAWEGPREEALRKSQDESEEEDEEKQVLKNMAGQGQENGPQGLLCPPDHHPCSNPQSPAEVPPGNTRKNSVGLPPRSKYNTVSYRTIRKGNTRQRIDEFESMMHS